jgi:DNA polymerase-3 subunit chi
MVASVEFHTGVADPVPFACRLLRKAYRSGARVLLTAPAATLAALDEALWTFEAQGFVPHVRVPGPASALAPRTPIWLASEAPPPPRPPVLVNLGASAPAGPDDFERVIEVVGLDEPARRAARERWRHYEQWGVTPLHHAGAA